nr:cell surface glycoprotein 1-like [Aegilops tauschii subsp. strangulata]
MDDEMEEMEDPMGFLNTGTYEGDIDMMSQPYDESGYQHADEDMGVDRMVGKGPERPEPPASATGRGGSIIPGQPLRRALLDSMQTAAAGASSSAVRGRGRTKKAARGGRGSGRVRKAATPSSPPPSADSPDHRTAPSDVDPSRTPVHEPPIADPSPHQTRVADPSPHQTRVTDPSCHVSPVPESSSQKTPVPESLSHETPEASGPTNGSEDTFSDDSYSDDELVEKGKKTFYRFQRLTYAEITESVKKMLDEPVADCSKTGLSSFYASNKPPPGDDPFWKKKTQDKPAKTPRIKTKANKKPAKKKTAESTDLNIDDDDDNHDSEGDAEASRVGDAESPGEAQQEGQVEQTGYDNPATNPEKTPEQFESNADDILDDPPPQDHDFVDHMEIDPIGHADKPPSPDKNTDKPPSPVKTVDDKADDVVVIGFGYTSPDNPIALSKHSAKEEISAADLSKKESQIANLQENVKSQQAETSKAKNELTNALAVVEKLKEDFKNERASLDTEKVSLLKRAEDAEAALAPVTEELTGLKRQINAMTSAVFGKEPLHKL